MTTLQPDTLGTVDRITKDAPDSTTQTDRLPNLAGSGGDPIGTAMIVTAEKPGEPARATTFTALTAASTGSAFAEAARNVATT